MKVGQFSGGRCAATASTYCERQKLLEAEARGEQVAKRQKHEAERLLAYSSLLGRRTQQTSQRGSRQL
jgi:hypothetical protein